MRCLRSLCPVLLLPPLLTMGAVDLAAQSATAARVGPVATMTAADSLLLRARGAEDGLKAAQARSTNGSFTGGVASGLLLPFYGLLVAYPIANRAVTPDAAGLAAMADSSSVYTSAFRAAYGREHRSARRAATVKGYLLGTVPWVILVVGMSDF